LSPGAHGVAVALAHEAPAAGLMLAACLAGGAAALSAGALALALLSMGYARAARTSAFAREHLVDLWAMVLLLAGTAFAGQSAPAGSAAGSVASASAGHRHLAGLADAPLAAVLVVGAAAGWVIGRLLLARRVRRPHTVVSAVVCGGMLAAMLVF
jgi:hypothetical protein